MNELLFTGCYGNQLTGEQSTDCVTVNDSECEQVVCSRRGNIMTPECIQVRFPIKILFL
jgi:hypothetical protein